MTLRQLAREFYEGIASPSELRILPALRERRVGRELIAGGATTSCDAAPAASGSMVASSTESGLMATDSGGRRTMGGPFGKRSGCAV